jgi:hypothetical protein
MHTNLDGKRGDKGSRGEKKRAEERDNKRRAEKRGGWVSSSKVEPAVSAG